MEKNDEFGIEKYGKEAWENIVSNYDYEEKEKAKLFDTLTHNGNMDKVLRFIEGLLSIENLRLNWSLEKSNNSESFIRITSNNLALENKVLSLAWSSFKISNNYCWVLSNQSCKAYGDENYYKNRATEFCYYFDLSFRYEHLNGGYNGANIGEIYIYKDKISYKLDKEFYIINSEGNISTNRKARVDVPFKLD